MLTSRASPRVGEVQNLHGYFPDAFLVFLISREYWLCGHRPHTNISDVHSRARISVHSCKMSTTVQESSKCISYHCSVANHSGLVWGTSKFDDRGEQRSDTTIQVNGNFVSGVVFHACSLCHSRGINKHICTRHRAPYPWLMNSQCYHGRRSNASCRLRRTATVDSTTPTASLCIESFAKAKRRKLL